MSDRERFELWVKREYPSADTGLDLHGDYTKGWIDGMWEAWQEATKQASNATFPVFDILDRLYESGHYTKKQDDRWWLFDKDGEGIASGQTFRGLCVKIVLSGL